MSPIALLEIETPEALTRRRLLEGAVAAMFLAACDRGGSDDDLDEAATRSFTHLGGITEIPVRPRRIVTVQDQNALLPLLELGVRPIASAGSEDGLGGHLFRRTEGFDTEGIAFVGNYWEPDRELVAQQEPDLIIGDGSHLEIYDSLSQIAPTILLDVFDKPLHEALRDFADAVGALDEWERLKARYDEAVEALIADLPRVPEEITLSCLYVSSGDGSIYPAQGFHSVSTALVDSRIGRPASERGLDEATYSFELLAQHDADVMLVAYWEDSPDADPNYQYFAQSPVTRTLDVFRRGEVHPFNGNALTGSSFQRLHAVLDFLRATLVDRTVNFPA